MRVTENRAEVARAVRRGLASFAVPEPMTLREWAEQYFYLPAEASYVEQRWEAWPFQRAILSCVGSDDIQEVNVIKSARVGYTKILLAAIGYFAEHKKRNQALWQPSDSARDKFSKTEIDPMIRDVEILHPIFPALNKRHKDNTLELKKFGGRYLYLYGGKAADNYRRISVSVAMLDEYSSFDNDIEGEGDPATLASKRLEGATFPKFVIGSTPKRKGGCLMDRRVSGAKALYKYHVPCIHCDELHEISWGGKDEPHGFKWVDHDPSTVKHLCPHCGTFSTQGDYLAVADKGIYVGSDGTTIDHEGVFRDSAGEVIPSHSHIAFHVWTAYSPATTWTEIVGKFLEANEEAQKGETTKMQTFMNTTLGQAWEGESDELETAELKRRAEMEGFLSPGLSDNEVPSDCALLLAGVDTQGNRLEVGVWGFGVGGKMWSIDHHIIFGNPAEDAVWDELEEFLFERRYLHEGGKQMPIYASAIDTGGHHTHAVYDFARRHRVRRVYAIRGRPVGEKHIKDGVTQVDIDWKGKRSKKGVRLWYVGTNMAKDLLYGRLQVEVPGQSGYVCLAADLSDEWFEQFTAERRVIRKKGFSQRSFWEPRRARNEVLDCCVYAIWLEAHLELSRKTDAWWRKLFDKLGVVDDDSPENKTQKSTPEKSGVSVSAPSKPPSVVRRPQVRRVASSYLKGRR